MRGRPAIWDVNERYVRLSDAGNSLEKLNAIVPCEVFRRERVKRNSVPYHLHREGDISRSRWHRSRSNIIRWLTTDASA